jgi:ATP-binding cassette, subfamily C, bacterial LapB
MQPQVLLMDEPTSSMDAQSETAFLRRLKEAVGARSLVVVTHRPAVLELVQRIVVLDQGKVIIDGPKAQVLAALAGVRTGESVAPSARVAVPAAAAALGPEDSPADALEDGPDDVPAGMAEGTRQATPEAKAEPAVTA